MTTNESEDRLIEAGIASSRRLNPPIAIDKARVLARDYLEAQGFADAEAESARLRAGRGAPDILIDKHGDAWFRTESGNYSILGTGDGMVRSKVEEMWGPVIEAWR